MNPFHIIFLVIIFTATLFSYDTAYIKKLSTKSTWLSLLHYDLDGHHSLVLNDTFFLSKNGAVSPYEEMLETIKSYEKNETKHICRFPARMFWIGKHLHWKNIQKRLSRCKALNAWETIQNVDSISAVFVSGFLGNPASAFGHSFLKLNKHNKNNLEDITIGYGAKLPKKYTMFSYIFNGLTGGYKAAFTDKYYYMDNMVYSNKEYRDMWEYRLHLSETDKKLLLYHLWELRSVEFRYYFLNRNCGYMLSDVLDVVSHIKLQDHAYVWYAPIETFYALAAFKHSSLFVDQIVYHASFQKKLYEHYRFLTKIQKKHIVTIIESKKVSSNMIHELSTREIDFLLDYFFYMFEGVDEQILQKKYKFDIHKKRLLMLERMQRNATKTVWNPIKEPPITSFNQTSMIKIGYQNNTLVFNYVPFVLDKLGYNIQKGDYFTVLDTTLYADKHFKDVRYAMDVISIRKLHDIDRLPDDKESIFSWKILFQINNMIENEDQIVLNTGVGLTYAINENWRAFGFIDFQYATALSKGNIKPDFGLFFQENYIRFELGYKNIINENTADFDYAGYIEGQYNFNPKNGFYFLIEKNSEESNTQIGIKWYF